MPSVTPSTDPLYAWDVPGWTIQKGGSLAAAGLNLEGSPGVNATSLAGGGAAISGFLGTTMDPPSAVTAALTVAANTFYGGLVYLPEGGVTTKYTVFASTATGGTHVYALLLSVSSAAPTVGTVVAAGADVQGAIPQGVAASWAASATIAPGFYYAGVVFGATTPVMWGATANSTVIANSTSATLPRFVTGSLTPGASAPALGSTITLASQSSLGGIFMGFF